jgi:hypothetical protein
MLWKISAEDRKIIRQYAADAARTTPRRIGIRVGERYNVDDPTIDASFNIKLVDNHPTWDHSDLRDHWDFADVRSIPLDAHGEAEVDFYIYHMEGFGANRQLGDLETNVQAHIRLVDGKPRIWKMTDTDFKVKVLIPL